MRPVRPTIPHTSRHMLRTRIFCKRNFSKEHNEAPSKGPSYALSEIPSKAPRLLLVRYIAYYIKSTSEAISSKETHIKTAILLVLLLAMLLQML